MLASGETPLGGAFGPGEVIEAPVVALPRRQVVAVTEGNALDRLFDPEGYSRVAGTAALLPGPDDAGGGERALRGRGPRGARPGPSAGRVARARRPRWTCRSSGFRSTPPPSCAALSARACRPSCRSARPPSTRTPSMEAWRRSLSTGLALDGSAQPEIGAPGVGLVTSVPGRNKGGSARYGTISGLQRCGRGRRRSGGLARRREGPISTQAACRGALAAAARRGSTGCDRRPREPRGGASAAELVADPPSVTLGALLARRRGTRGELTPRNVTRLPAPASGSSRPPRPPGSASRRIAHGSCSAQGQTATGRGQRSAPRPGLRPRPRSAASSSRPRGEAYGCESRGPLRSRSPASP